MSRACASPAGGTGQHTETLPSHKQADQNIMLKIPHKQNAFHYCLPAKPSHFRGQRISKSFPARRGPLLLGWQTHRLPPLWFTALSICYFSLTRSKMLPSSPSPAITPSQPHSKPAGPAPRPKPCLFPKTADTHAPTPQLCLKGTDHSRMQTLAFIREKHTFKGRGDGGVKRRAESSHSFPSGRRMTQWS